MASHKRKTGSGAKRGSRSSAKKPGATARSSSSTGKSKGNTNSKNKASSGTDSATLRELRREIDHLDQRIVGLLNRRAAVTANVGRLKRSRGAAPYYVARREQEVYDNIAELNGGPLPDDSLRAIYRELMSASLAAQTPFTVCFPEAYGSPPHDAAVEKFGDSVAYQAVDSVEEVFARVARSDSQYGVIPAENSLVSNIGFVVDLFISHDVRICAEVFRDEHHFLAARGSLTAVGRVYGTPRALAESRSWLSAHLPEAAQVQAPGAAAAAALAAREVDAAALTSEAAARLHSLTVHARRVEDVAVRSRYFVLSREFSGPSRKDKTSLVFLIPHRPGALVRAFEPFRDRDVNLIRFESRRSRNRRQFYFYLELSGHCTEPKVAEALEEMRARCAKLKVLGSYPLTGET